MLREPAQAKPHPPESEKGNVQQSMILAIDKGWSNLLRTVNLKVRFISDTLVYLNNIKIAKSRSEKVNENIIVKQYNNVNANGLPCFSGESYKPQNNAVMVLLAPLDLILMSQ